MLRAAQARRIATATAFGGGGLTVLGASTVGLLYLQARLAHRAVGVTPWAAPPVDGLYGHAGKDSTDPVAFAMLGDSTAAGFAVADAAQTPAALLATGIAAAAQRPVRVRSVAVVGATSRDLGGQVDQLRDAPPDLAVVFVGANDVIRRARPAESVRHLQYAVRELVGMGTAVVVGTCPDLGTVRPIAAPLRYVARRASRQLAAAQTIAVVEEGGRSVSLSDLLADEFQTHPDEMFGPDRFHPSAHGYAQAAAAVLPSACAALGLPPDRPVHPRAHRGEGVLPVARAAVAAAEQPGTEVSGVRVGGRERGPRGRWAALMRGRPRPPAEERPPGAQETAPDGGGAAPVAERRAASG
ncbi:SGNH/GDSL hydrolase family protein [Marinitenerispora sediminis]|uniref:SGNH/GDSL hydrolase family protein n=1 Tax=Marinitenerispora sediminis TaxID=1931232 RepID=UPI0015F18231|nr:SGNH/GDSL hydrolase family protein [Marinitenerispora sediminis]